jgi:putative ABC transport system permease protein
VLRPRWRKVLRDLWLHKPRTVLVLLAIAVGIAGAGAVLDTWALLRRVTAAEFLASNPAGATLRTESIDDGLLARVRAMPGVRAAHARRVVTASAQVASEWHSAVLYAVSDLAAPRIGMVKPEAGAWPPTDRTLVVERSSMSAAAMPIGTAIVVRAGDGPPVALPVTGIARDVGLAPGWMEHVVYAFVTPATLARLGVPSSFDELQIVAGDGHRDRSAMRRLAYQVKAVVEATGRRVTSVDVPVPGRHVHAAQMDSLLYTQGAFGALALLLSGLLVVNLIGAMLAGQVREIGVMKAVGAGDRQLAAMYLATAFALGLGACAIGMPAAAFLGRAYARFTADLLNFDVAGHSIPGSVMLLQLAVGTLLPVAAAAVPVARGCRIPVGEALRELGIAARRGGARGAGRLLQRAGGLTRPLLLSLRNAFRRRERLALTLITLSTGGAVYLGALDLRASIAHSVDLLFGSNRYDIGLRMARPYPPGALEAAVAAVPGVARTEAWCRAEAAATQPDGTLGNFFSITAPSPSSRMLAPAVQQGRWLRAGDGDALVVNRRLIEDQPDLVAGARVTLLIEGRPSRWRIVGVVDAGPTAEAFAPRATLAGLVGGGGANVAVIAAASATAAAQLELVQRLRVTLPPKGFQVVSSALKAQRLAAAKDHMLMIAAFLGLMGQLMILVGGLGMASTMSIAMLERTREIGVLRAIGARNRTILAMVQIEGLVIAAASWLLALPLSVPMSFVLARAFGRIMLPVPVTLLPDVASVLRWLAMVLAVSLVTSTWPAWRAMRVTTAAALAYE